MIGPDGGIWFTQGGASLYRGEFDNHSRIVRFDPEEETFDTYTLPGEGNEVIALAFDETGRLWFSQAGQDQGAIGAFDPMAVAPDGSRGSAPENEWCDSRRDGCFIEIPLDRTNSHPAHLLIEDEVVWFTEFFGNSIASLDIESGEVRSYPAGRSTRIPPRQVGTGPWEIYIDEPSGDVVFNKFFASQLVWFDSERALARPQDCRRADRAVVNRCATAVPIAADLDSVSVHSIIPGVDGRTWFTMQSGEDDAPTSIGFVLDRREVHVFGDLRLVDPDGGGGQAGIAVDPVNGDIWFAEFSSNSVGRLRLR